MEPVSVVMAGVAAVGAIGSYMSASSSEDFERDKLKEERRQFDINATLNRTKIAQEQDQFNRSYTENIRQFDKNMSQQYGMFTEGNTFKAGESALDRAWQSTESALTRNENSRQFDLQLAQQANQFKETDNNAKRQIAGAEKQQRISNKGYDMKLALAGR